jgi:hypothetical protein
MITPPTDYLYKFTAVGGLTLALAGGAGALHQYDETGKQQADFVGAVMKTANVSNRFAIQAREQLSRTHKLMKPGLTPAEVDAIELQTQKFRELIPAFDKDFEEALSAANKQEAITAHFRKMQAIWLVLGGIAIGVGIFISYRGFRRWHTLPNDNK